MSDAPAWLVRLLSEHHALPVQNSNKVACFCLWSPEDHLFGTAAWQEVYAHVAQTVWDALHEGQFVARNGRVIPSRTTDPATSHQAAATITVKAGTQRAHLLEAFLLCDNQDWRRDRGMTDEEAMNLAYPKVLPESEYSKRCSELREAGLIEPTGVTRTGSSGHQRIVSRITEAGRKAVASL